MIASHSMDADGDLSELEAMEVVSVASDEAGDNEQIDFSVREEYSNHAILMHVCTHSTCIYIYMCIYNTPSVHM